MPGGSATFNERMCLYPGLVKPVIPSIGLGRNTRSLITHQGLLGGPRKVRCLGYPKVTWPHLHQISPPKSFAPGKLTFDERIVVLRALTIHIIDNAHQRLPRESVGGRKLISKPQHVPISTLTRSRIQGEFLHKLTFCTVSFRWTNLFLHSFSRYRNSRGTFSRFRNFIGVHIYDEYLMCPYIRPICT